MQGEQINSVIKTSCKALKQSESAGGFDLFCPHRNQNLKIRFFILNQKYVCFEIYFNHGQPGRPHSITGPQSCFTVAGRSNDGILFHLSCANLATILTFWLQLDARLKPA